MSIPPDSQLSGGVCYEQASMNIRGIEMIHHQRSIEISAAPEAIWSVLGRFMHIDEFAPQVKSVEALTDGENGVGSKRRCHFENGTSVAEEIINWQPNQSYRVKLSEMDAMPLHEASAEIAIERLSENRSKINWSMDYRMKYGPLGWLLGQTMMKMMMGKILDGNLKGLSDRVLNASST